MAHAHLQYMPGDPRLVDQLVYELKSKGIFDQFRKECIADVDTRPAYQNLRQRVESSVAMFLSRQCWKPDLNKNQLREKLRKHILDGNYLEQGVERIVDQVVNPKVASVFIPQVEDLVYNYLGITRKKNTPVAETSNGKTEDLLPTDLEAVSPGSVKSNDDKEESMEIDEKENSKMETDEEKPRAEEHDDSSAVIELLEKQKVEAQDTHMSEIIDIASRESDVSIDKSTIPLPAEEIKLENIPPPENSPPKIELENIELPKEPNLSTDIPLPDEIPKLDDKEQFFKPINSEDDDSSSDSSLRRNMSPLTPIRNFNNENSCDAQQAFENDSEESKAGEKKEPNTFRFTIESKSSENSSDETKIEKKDAEQSTLSYQFNNQVKINVFNTPLYEDSSNSNNLQIDYESDANSKQINAENKGPEAENSEESKKEQKTEEKKSSSHKGSHRSRDSHRHSSSSKDRRSDSAKHSSSRDRKDSKHDKKSTKDDHKSKPSHSERSRDRSDKKDSRDSSKHRSSHKSSSHKDSKSHRSSSSSQRHSSKHSEQKKSSLSTQKDKSEKSSREHKSSRDSKHSSHRSDRGKDKDRKSSSSKTKQEEKDKEKKDKKESDDHYSLSGRGNNGRRSTDRDSNDGSSSSKGSHNRSSSKTSESKKDSKGTSSKSENTSTGSDTPSPSDKDHVVHEITNEHSNTIQPKPIVRVETHLETPISTPPRLPFVPDVTLKKPKFAANLKEAKKLMKMRKFLDEEQKRMNQEAALLLEFQANVRPSLSQVYSSISGPELEFACVTNTITPTEQVSMENNQVIIVDDHQIIYDNTTLPVENEDMNENKRLINEEYCSETIKDIRNEIEHPTLVQISEGMSETCEAVLQENEISGGHSNDNIKVLPGEGQTYRNNLNNDELRYSIEDVKAVNNGIIIENEGDFDESFTKKSKREVMEIILGNISDFEENSDATTPLLKETINDTMEQNMDKNSDLNIKNQVFHRKSIQTVEEIEESKKRTEFFEITIITEEISENEDTRDVNEHKEELNKDNSGMTPEKPLEFFAEYEKYKAELERDEFSKFLKDFIEKTLTEKLYLINCDTYEENIIKEVSEKCGTFEVVNYYKNGHLTLKSNSKANVVKNVNVATELTLPIDQSNNETEETKSDSNPLVFSPVKSECSFELSSDYDAKLEEMVNKTSRQEVMEIILGGVIEESPSKMPKIDYCMDSNIEVDNDNPLKRTLNKIDSLENNNRKILTPKKIRKLSGSDQISSTTEDGDERPDSTNKVSINIRSKYLGKARRVGLPKLKKSNLPNSPSSDKSVENYEDNVNTPKTPNGKIKTSPRIKVQRYDKSELYKPKLHYLSRRNMNN